MYIRYFAHTDGSPLGIAAAAYCDALVDTGTPVRLIAARAIELQPDELGRRSSIWDRHRDLLTTPLVGGYVNVVCGTLDDWQRFYTPGATNALLVAGQNVELFAEAVRWNHDLDAAMRRYEIVYANSLTLAAFLQRWTGIDPVVVHVGTPEAASAFRRLQVF